MQRIDDTVGENGVNDPSDSSLVQAILMKIKRPASRNATAGHYLTAYDGDCGKNTKAAIQAFQDDNVFVSNDGRQCVNNPRATAGLVKFGDATWEKLLENIDPAFSDMRVLKGGKTVYLSATAEQLADKLNDANSKIFTAAFRLKVIACINQMHEQYGIAIGVCEKGDRRDFQTQYALRLKNDGSTNAGPGESNHNFGMAVDFGFRGLRWLKKHGEVVENEDSWLHVLDPKQTVGPEALKFWGAMRAVGTSGVVGAFHGPEADRPHLQNWSDAGVDVFDRLAVLLTLSGKMRWRGTKQDHYSCDLGFGGDLYHVGTAMQIWNRQATVTVAMLNQARAAQASRTGQRPGAPAIPVPIIPGRLPIPNPHQRNAPQIAQATLSDVVATQQALRREFELADANWPNWTPR